MGVVVRPWHHQFSQETGCPMIPGSVHCQVGRGFEQHGLEDGVPAHIRVLEQDELPTQTILAFCDSSELGSAGL